MQRSKTSTRERAFTMTELITSVAVIGILAGIGFVVNTNLLSSISGQKLSNDIRVLNEAITSFKANGGNLDELTTAQQVLDRLKTRASDGQNEKLVGLRSSVIDPRIVPVLQSSSEAASTAERAQWDSSKQRFAIKNSGSAGVKEFVLDESLSGAVEAAHDRKLTVAYSSKGEKKWVWEYTDHEIAHAAPNTPGPNTIGTPAGLTPYTPSEALPLEQPIASIAGGTYPINDYTSFEVTLTNPNPPGVSETFYSITPSNWTRYSGPISITPGSTLNFYAATLHGTEWTDSGTGSEEYLAETVKLEIALNFNNTSYNYVTLGGPLKPGSYPTPTQIQPGAISLTNASDIPASLQSSDAFNVYWTRNGSDPRSGTATEGDDFTNGFNNVEVPVWIEDWNPDGTAEISAYAKSHNPGALTNSDLVTETLTATAIDLRTPVITVNQPTAGTRQLEITLQSDFGDTPLGARIFYTTDGTDPGIGADGEPIRGEYYSGVVDIAMDVTEIRAQVYPPPIYRQWFMPSQPGTATPAPVALPVSFDIAVSTTPSF